MRIAIDALAVTPGRPGGDATYVRELVRHLPGVGASDEWIVYVRYDAQSLFPAAPDNVRYVACSVPGRSFVVRALWEQMALPRLVRRDAPEVFHAPVNVAPLVLRMPVVLTLHEAEPFMPGAGIPLPLLAWWRVMRARSARRACRILAVSEAAKGEIVRWMGVPEAKVRVVHSGVDLERFQPSAAPEPPLMDGAYILWAGRPYPRKNLPRLVRAFEIVRRAGRPERLVLAGISGWAERELLGALDASSDGDAIVRRGPLPAGDLPGWYRQAALYAFPSLHEAFGFPMLEAMACGTPVVAGDIPALREVGGDAAVYADPCSPESIAEAMLTVLDNPERAAELRQAGLARAARFTWQATAAATRDSYRA